MSTMSQSEMPSTPPCHEMPSEVIGFAAAGLAIAALVKPSA